MDRKVRKPKADSKSGGGKWKGQCHLIEERRLMGENYPSHMYDPVRRSIAERYVKHEFMKLFPNLRDNAAWETIKEDVSGWFSENPTLARVRDFWNGVHAISMGFKLKRLVPWLTSIHIEWSDTEVQTEDLWFTSRLTDLKEIGSEHSAKAAKAWFLLLTAERH